MGLTQGGTSGGTDKGDGAAPRGLAALLSPAPGDDNAILLGASDRKPSCSSGGGGDSSATLRSAACHVLELSAAEEAAHLGPGRDALAGVLSALQDKTAAAAQADASGRTTGAEGPSSSTSASNPAASDAASSHAALSGALAAAAAGAHGRLGPTRVVIDRSSARGQLQYGNGDLAGEEQVQGLPVCMPCGLSGHCTMHWVGQSCGADMGCSDLVPSSSSGYLAGEETGVGPACVHCVHAMWSACAVRNAQAAHHCRHGLFRSRVCFSMPVATWQVRNRACLCVCMPCGLPLNCTLHWVGLNYRHGHGLFRSRMPLQAHPWMYAPPACSTQSAREHSLP